FLLVGRLDALPMILLCLGLATQTTRVLRRRWARVSPYLRRGLIWLVLLFACITSVGIVESSLTRHRQVSAMPAAPTSAPNVLLVTLDTVRAQNLSLYGYSRLTSPLLEKW